MKIKESYVLRSVAGENLIVPVGGNNINFNSAMTLNETGAFLWQLLTADTTRDALIAAMTKEYDIDAETAAKDIDIFITSLKEHSILED
ncbi:MAG: PqqD family protein [Acutalibacteraceae bacterium]|nr:PqqD family protein [Acutalibacteraceae bacterium]